MILSAFDPHTPVYAVARRDSTLLPSDQFARHTAVIAHTLKSHAAQQVVLHCDDAYWFAAAMLAAWYAGKTVALPGDLLSAATISGLALLDQGAIEALLSTDDVDSLIGVELDESAAQLLIYTSGSSGQPKAIAKTLQLLLNEVAALEQAFGAQVGDACVLGTVSQQHIYGLLFRIIWPLASRRTFATQAAFFPETLIAQSAQAQRVIWVSSPAHYKRLDATHGLEGIRSNINMLFSSGGILPASIAQQVQDLSGVAVTEIFGSSETGGVAQRQNSAPWRSLPGVRVAINDAGALTINSPHLSAAQLANGAYVMDDAATMHADGRFELLGRLDRIVKIEEKRIALASIEAALLLLDVVKDAAALALQASNRQSIAAVIVLNSDVELKRQGKYQFCEQLKRQLAASLPALAIPRRWRFVASVPSNAQGKVSVAALRALFDEPTAVAVSADKIEQTRRVPAVLSVHQDDAETAKYVYQLAISADIAYFAGHFPQQPVLPGVTQIHWAVHFARQHWALPAQFLRLEVIKFQQVIMPGNDVQLELAWDDIKQRLVFAFTSASGAHSSGRIVFGDAS